MNNLFFSLHRIAAQRGDGLRSEFFKRYAGHDAELLRLYRKADIAAIDKADPQART